MTTTSSPRVCRRPACTAACCPTFSSRRSSRPGRWRHRASTRSPAAVGAAVVDEHVLRARGARGSRAAGAARRGRRCPVQGQHDRDGRPVHAPTPSARPVRRRCPRSASSSAARSVGDLRRRRGATAGPARGGSRRARPRASSAPRRPRRRCASSRTSTHRGRSRPSAGAAGSGWPRSGSVSPPKPYAVGASASTSSLDRPVGEGGEDRRRGPLDSQVEQPDERPADAEPRQRGRPVTASGVSTMIPTPTRPRAAVRTRSTSASRRTIGTSTSSAPRSIACSTSSSVPGPTSLTRHDDRPRADLANGRQAPRPARRSVSGRARWIARRAAPSRPPRPRGVRPAGPRPAGQQRHVAGHQHGLHGRSVTAAARPGRARYPSAAPAPAR